MLTDLLFRIRTVFRKQAAEEALDDELRFHLEQHAATLVAAGCGKAEAYRAARMTLGGPEQLKEQCRDAWGIRLWEATVADMRQACRHLKQSPAATATIVLTLALCIGANAAVYSIVDALFFRPLPYPHPEQLVMVTAYKGSEQLDTSQDGIEWEALRDHATALVPAVYGPTLGANLVRPGDAAYIHTQRISANLFHVLGVPLYRGREFARSEDVPNGPALAVVSYAFWQRAFHADPNIIGCSIALNSVPYTVVGIASPMFRAIPESDFGSLDPPDVYTPIRPSTEGEGSGDNYGVIARLKPGISVAQANVQLKHLTPEILSRRGAGARSRVEEERALPLQAGLVYDIRSGIHIMWAAVFLVLVIGCINIAGLLLAQSSVRSREVAMRRALGASGWRIVSSQMTESLMLAGFGAVLGLVLGHFALAELLKLNPDEFNLLGGVRLDGRVVLITAAAAFGAAVLFGFFPAWEVSRVDLRSSLADGSRTSAGHRRDYRRHALVFAEIALGVMLVTSAGLLVRTLLGSTGPDPGFDPKGLLVASASLADPKYGDPATAARLFGESTKRMEELPEVQAAAVALAAPYTRPLNEGISAIGGKRLDAGTELNYITPNYFETLRVKLLRGRVFSDADDAKARRVVVVNDTFVRFYLPHADPVGTVLTLENERWTIIGVTGSVQENNHLNHTVPVSFYPEVYVPVAQCPAGLLPMANQWFSPVWLVRTRREDAALPRAIQKALSSVDPALPFAQFRSIDAIRATTLGPERYRAWVVSCVSGLAVTLAALGVYGLVAQSVAQRRREIGIRMALGATAARVVRTCTTPAMAVACAGVICGLGGAAFAATLMKGLVWNVSPFDPATYVSVALLLFLLTCVASLLPAMRLRRINAAQILQGE